MNIPSVALPRVVIIGGGFAGLNLAKRLSSERLQVVLIDKHNYHTFQPLLYQVATAGLEPDSIAHALRTLFKQNKNFHFRIANVQSIDYEKKEITSDIGPLRYDTLIIAAGSDTNFYGNHNIEKYAIAMKSVVEALNIRHIVLQNFEKALLTNDLDERAKLMNFVIVGGGPTGVELAGAFAELKNHVLAQDYPDLDVRQMNVHLIQGNHCLLPGFSSQASKAALDYLIDMDVQVWLDTHVQDYDGTVVTTERHNFTTDTVIWAAGVKGNLISGLPEEAINHGRYNVDEFNRIIGINDIYAIGDIALMTSEAYPHGHPMVAQVAIQQGKLLADNIHREMKQEPQQPFRYKDKGSMATIGRNKAVVNLGDKTFTGFWAWLIWMFVHLFSLVGFRNKVVALVNWIIQYFQYNKGVRLIIRPYRRKTEQSDES